MRIGFMGGADTVTGSQHIVEVNGSRVLRDCGMFQGRRKEADSINRNLPFDPRTIDAMLLSHAHIDHSGNIPTLTSKGFRGPIHATTATSKIAGIMLRDSAFIQEQDAAYLNQKTNRRGKPPVIPLYTMEDAARAMDAFEPHSYHQAIEAVPGIRFTDYEAGHILGSSLTHFELEENGSRCSIGFAVDLGRKNLPLIRDPEFMPELDVLVIESTYGNRLHGPAVDAEEQLGRAILDTYKRGGKVIIPSFALERAQELLFHISSLIMQNRIPKYPVYIDSPMALNVTRVFDRSTDYMDEEFNAIREDMTCLMCPPWVHFTESVQESKEITAATGPMIVIAASGMCEHGRILHHLKHGIGDPANTILIVGYQAEHTLGRRLVEQQTEVRIFGDQFERKAPVEVLNAFSAHADRNELLEYVRQTRPRRVFLVHGEKKQREALAGGIQDVHRCEVNLPKRGDWVELV